MNVLIADDHPVFLHGLERVLSNSGHNVVAAVSDGTEAVRIAQEQRIDVIVLDYSMPKMNGIASAIEIIRTMPGAKIVLLTAHRDEQFLETALSVGIRGYVLKDEAVSMLPEAVQQVARGNTFVSSGMARAYSTYLGLISRSPGRELLSPREVDVLKLVAAGHSTKEVAETLSISVKTAESYRSAVMSKLDIHDIAGLVRYAVRRGLVAP